MQWMKAIDGYIQALKPASITPVMLQRMFSFIDLTSLNENDTEENIISLFEKANTTYGHVAAVCIYPRFIRLAVAQFANTPVKVATVVNFPHGSSSLESVLLEINQALEDGVQEIDMVFPYERYLAGERDYAHHFISASRAACGVSAPLKVILETGALNDPAIIPDASYEAMIAGADFVKTSTGRNAQGASLEAAAVMLLVIKHISAQLKRTVGLKVSGGIRSISQAVQYIQLAEQIMGAEWVMPHTFRIGASQLVNEILGK